MKLFLLPEDLRNDLLAYMMEQPYKLVAKGIARLTELVEIQPPTAPAPPPPPDKKE